MFRIRLKLPDDIPAPARESFGALLDGLAVSHSLMRESDAPDAPWIAEWLVGETPNRVTLDTRLHIHAALHGLDLPAPDWQIEQLPEIDWLAHSYKQFEPFTVGPLFIHGSHYQDAVPGGLIGMQIDAATAFGSGEHGTTKGCLMAMLDLKGKGVCPWNVLDMGTGSGILAIAAWKLWQTPVLAVDNDAEAVRVARHHQDINGIKSGAAAMACEIAEGFAAPVVQQKKPFEMIIANILAGSLIEMAADLAACCDERGFAILSGILNEQAAAVTAAYELQGFTLKDRIVIGNWSTLVVQR